MSVLLLGWMSPLLDLAFTLPPISKSPSFPLLFSFPPALRCLMISWFLFFYTSIYKNYLLLELNTLWCWKQTQGDIENLDKAISFDQKGASIYSLLLSRHTSTKWGLLISLMQLYLPLTWDLSRSKVDNLSQLGKSLGGWVRACNSVGNFHGQWDCTRIQKKKQAPFKQCRSPKMVTWGILSNLRGWHMLW
jgi:hypothetical protein